MSNEPGTPSAADVHGYTMDCYLKLGTVKGECTATRDIATGQATGRRQHDPIQLLSFSFGVSQR